MSGSASSWSFEAALWRWRSGSWFFVTVPETVSDAVDDVVGDATRGFGSVPVEVMVGSSTWRTSLFPSREEQAFVLPVKKAVRTAEGLDEGDLVTFVIRLRSG